MQEVLGLVIVLVVILIILNGIARTPYESDVVKDYAVQDVPVSQTPNYPTETQKRILEMLRETPVWYYFDEKIRDVKYLEFSLDKAPVVIKFRSFDTVGVTNTPTDDDIEAAQSQQVLEPKMWKWGPEPGTITLLLDGSEHVLVLSLLSDHLLEFFEYDSSLIKNEKLQPFNF